jgi:cbb3-type cytochrome oxidase subunit 3
LAIQQSTYWKSLNNDDLKETTMGMSILLLLLIAAFVAIVVWVFGRNRKVRFAKAARIPLDEEPPGRGQD